MDVNEIIPYIEPIFIFCCKRLSNRCDAEDLSSEIIYHILDGMRKYKIESLDAWVWRIAHNRYARLIDARNKSQLVLTEDETLFDAAYCDRYFVDEEADGHEFETVFTYLHTLSSEYRNIFVDYYIGEMSIRMLSKKYSLPETTIKWRLNVGRQRIKKRIGEHNMNKIYNRINWNTNTCNGYMDSDKYLHTQIARAVCRAAYEKPLTVEEISMSTGLPAMYIEDELPRLEYGDAICKTGNNKYATNFIIFSLEDRKYTEGASSQLVRSISDKFEALLQSKASAVNDLGFYGHDFGMERLGYIIIPYVLRHKIRALKNNRLKLESGPYPPRKDGGYGWFIVEETVDENENTSEYNTGCNVAGDDSGSENEVLSHIYYYWISKYFDGAVYHNGGTRWLCANGIPQGSADGMIEKDVLSDEDAARLIQSNLISKSGSDYKLNFACFTESQFSEFISVFDMDDGHLDDQITEWIMSVQKSFIKFVPDRLNDQINQWISCYLYQIIGYVIDELIHRSVLKKHPDKPLTDGVFFVKGKYIDP